MRERERGDGLIFLQSQNPGRARAEGRLTYYFFCSLAEIRCLEAKKEEEEERPRCSERLNIRVLSTGRVCCVLWKASFNVSAERLREYSNLSVKACHYIIQEGKVSMNCDDFY